MKKIRLHFYSLLVALYGFAIHAQAQLSQEEQKLYDLLTEYRATYNLPAIPISPALTKVAQAHVRDLQDNQPHGENCNMHSWSGVGKWTPCCYTSDHKQAQCMWDKPREMTNYAGNGYEIAYGGSAGATASDAIAGWKSSSGHNSVMINKGVWAKRPWNAVGIGIYGGYAVVWFGEEADNTPIPPIEKPKEKPKPVGDKFELISEKSSESATVLFVNEDSRTLEIYWADFTGKLILYTTLAPQKKVEQATYIGHVWVVKNADTGKNRRFIKVKLKSSKQTFKPK